MEDVEKEFRSDLDWFANICGLPNVAIKHFEAYADSFLKKYEVRKK